MMPGTHITLTFSDFRAAPRTSNILLAAAQLRTAMWHRLYNLCVHMSTIVHN